MNLSAYIIWTTSWTLQL